MGNSRYGLGQHHAREEGMDDGWWDFFRQSIPKIIKEIIRVRKK